MFYSNIDFSVVYIDPSTETPGDGSSPSSALENLPATAGDFANNTCYLIRRTDENFACVIPSGTNSSIRNILFMGMPTPSDIMYDFVPEVAKTAWGADSALYANIRSDNASGQLILSGIFQFLLHRIYLFRDNIKADR